LKEFLNFFVLKLDFRLIFPSDETSGSFQKLPEVSELWEEITNVPAVATLGKNFGGG